MKGWFGKTGRGWPVLMGLALVFFGALHVHSVFDRRQLHQTDAERAAALRARGENNLLLYEAMKRANLLTAEEIERFERNRPAARYEEIVEGR